MQGQAILDDGLDVGARTEAVPSVESTETGAVDASEREIKGSGRPIMPERERAELIAGMEAVDAVVIFGEPTCERLLRELRPDVHAKGTDYTEETVPEREIAVELGIRIVIAGAPKENASKDLIRVIQEG